MEEVVKFAGYILAALGAFTTWYASQRRAKVDESGQVIQAWKEITDRHEKEIASLRGEAHTARDKLREVEDTCYEERQEFRRTIENMQRQILQLHTSYLAQMVLLADPTNPDHAKLLQRASQLIEQVRKATEENG